MPPVKRPAILDSTLRQDIEKTAISDSDSGAECIANISMAERRKRLTFGVVTFAVSLAVLAILVVKGVDRLWRLPLFLLFWGAALGFFQWRDKT